MKTKAVAANSVRSPPPTRLRVVGRGWGWGACLPSQNPHLRPLPTSLRSGRGADRPRGNSASPFRRGNKMTGVGSAMVVLGIETSATRPPRRWSSVRADGPGRSCPTWCCRRSRSMRHSAAWCRRSRRAPMSRARRLIVGQADGSRVALRRPRRHRRHRRARADRRRDRGADDRQGDRAGEANRWSRSIISRRTR